MTERGYLTLAVGRSRYLEMAVDMALSLREHTALPVALATDEGLRDVALERYPRVFDEVTLVPERFRGGRTLKYGTAAASPFEQAMFVDADCIVLGSLEYLWSGLDGHDGHEGHDVAMLGELLTLADNENHHGFSTRRLMRRFGLDRYLKTNSGIFCFKRTPALAVMDECLECFVHEARPRLRGSILRGAWLGDEIGFGIVGGRRRLGTLPFPHPMYWPQEFPDLDLANPAKPLLHMIWPPRADTVDALVRDMRERRRAVGAPGDAEEHWREEIRGLHKMARRRRFLERFTRWGR